MRADIGSGAEAARSATPQARPQAPQRPVGAIGTAALGAGLLLLGGSLIGALLLIWPAVEPGARGGAATILGRGVSPGVALILLVIVASALGSYVHVATSFADFVGNRRLMASWVWWYVLRALIGIALALVFYFALRAGLFSTQGDAVVNPFGVAAIAGLVGMFSKQATDKLDEVFKVMFRTLPGRGDDLRGDRIDNPRPRIAGIEPAAVPAGADTVTLHLHGDGFIPESQVRVQRPDTDEVLQRTTAFVSPTELTVVLLGEDLEEEGTFELLVFNPEPGGGVSAVRRLDVHAGSDARSDAGGDASAEGAGAVTATP